MSKEVVKDTVKDTPQIQVYKDYSDSGILDVLNDKDFPQLVFRWVAEENFKIHLNRDWRFVTEDMGVKSNGHANSLGRIQVQELTLMYHNKAWMESRNQHMAKRTKERTEGIQSKAQSVMGKDYVNPDNYKK